MTTPGVAKLYEHENSLHAAQRLETFLVEEFPLELNDGDNVMDAAIKIMKDMKAQLGRRTASEMVFGNVTYPPERF